MKYSLVGCTGFVGGNLAHNHAFNNLYNSKNIGEAFGADNGFVVYAGMPAEKFLAAADPAADLRRAEQAFENITRMKPEKLVLISTVDVYPKPYKVYEDAAPSAEADESPALAYGKNRLALEGWVREAYPDALILRLPGLFGRGLKKNFIYDMLTLTPAMLVAEKYAELAEKEPLVRDSYRQDAQGFYRLQPLPAEKAATLRGFFEQNDFNSLSFTDSRSVFQFYDLANLWADIGRCQKHHLTLVNLATQPTEAGALYHFLFGAEFENHTAKGPVRYDMRTRHGRELGGLDDYIADRAEVVAGIAKLAGAWQEGGRP
ncbi:sugar nucleotide-binding protein [Ruminococcaceae bacterium OttesenSCG-928-D13]|nr:sugar nucleotide-binding protein [Ruminococcaceae bacterium OttesenSCG-928-D13]